MRKADLFLSLMAVGLLVLAFTFVDAALRVRAATADIERRARLVAELELMDLALFTEARYTRHASQADLHSAFQDHPMALDHFPSGSLVPAPRRGMLP